MPHPPVVFRSSTYEAGTKFPTARLVDFRTSDVLTQASFSGTVVVNVYDLSSATPAEAIYSSTRTVSQVVFNSLQDWEEDADGFNFRDSISSNDIIASNEVAWEGGHTYRLSYLLPHTTDGYFPVVFEMRCLALASL